MSEQTDSARPIRSFRSYFWRPPRARGNIEDRTVSFLELFHDLVYVVVIARAAHTLAEHVSWRGFAEFVVIFGLIWIAWWLNGTLHYELHGREDGRICLFVFLQMLGPDTGAHVVGGGVRGRGAVAALGSSRTSTPGYGPVADNGTAGPATLATAPTTLARRPLRHQGHRTGRG